jgi:leucyl-tRNA synthetase
MELVNAIYGFEQRDEHPGCMREALETLVRLLTPFVPHMCEELWVCLGHQGGIEAAGWPTWDEAALVEDKKTIVVQVNGKVRGKIIVAADADDDTVQQAALEEGNVVRFLEGKTVRKVVVVPGRLVSIVAS